MRLKTGLLTALAFSWLCLGPVSISQAGLTLKYGSGLAATSPGPFLVDVVISWDGTGANSFSTVDFDVTVPAGVTVLDNPTPYNPLNFQFASIASKAVSLVNFAGDVTTLTPNTDTTLTRMSFNVPSTGGSFPLGFSITGITRGQFGAENVTSQVSSVPANLVVAVPEPTSLGLLGVVSLAGFGWRRRRR